MPIHPASVQFPFIACYHYGGCAFPRSNKELGEAFLLRLKLICCEMCLAGPWVSRAFCLAAALAAARCRTVTQGTAPAASSNCCLLLLDSGTFHSALWVNTESTCSPVSWKVATFLHCLFFQSRSNSFLLILSGSNKKVESLLKLCAGNRECWWKAELVVNSTFFIFSAALQFSHFTSSLFK